MNSWQQVWAARRLDPSRGSTLAQLMAADGLDTGFGSLTEDAWRGFVLWVGDRIGAGDGTSVFDVGCGAGAFLLPLHERGCRVGGLDRSEALIEIARGAMPGRPFHLAEARTLDADDPWDLVVACAVLMYFPTREYTAEVLRAMARKARRGVAVLDLPDQALRDEALRMRRGALGEREYEERYRGLDHQYFERAWIVEQLERAGMIDVRAESQDIPGYANGAHRFNVFARSSA